MLWGSITQSVKALALILNFKITKHEHFFQFLQVISKELKDDYYYSTFLQLNDLHRNFYDEFIPEEGFSILYKKAYEFIKKIDVLILSRAK